MSKLNNLKPSYKLFIIIVIVSILFLFVFNQITSNNSKINITNYKTGTQRYNRTIKANNYEMKLQLNNETHTLSGNVKINITNHTNKKISSIFLRNYACALTGQKSIFSVSYQQTQLQFKEYGAKSALEDADIKVAEKTKDIASIIQVYLNQPLLPDQSITLQIEYSLNIPQKKDRFGYIIKDNRYIYQLSYCFPQLSPYIDDKWSNTPYIENAESDFNQLSNYSIHIDIPKNCMVIATGTETKAENTYHINAKQVRSVAMIIADHMKKSSIKINNIYLNHYYPEYENIDNYNQYVLDSAKEAMQLNTKYFGKYPYKQLDIVSCYYSSAMEYSGMVFLGLPDLYDLNQIHLSSYCNITQVVAHEVSHQWFGIAIGNDQYHEPWLDEAFAEYIEDIVFPLHSKTYQKAIDDDNKRLQMDVPYYTQAQFKKMMDQTISQKQNEHGINEPYYCYLKYYKPTGLDHKIISADDYSTYVYTNGSYFLYELSKEMGENEFYKMMQDYYQTYYLKEVTTVDFINIIYEHSDSLKIYQIINNYINQDDLKK